MAQRLRLLTLCALLSWPALAAATGKASHFVFTQLKYNGNWDVRPDPGRRLMWEVVKRTSIEAQFPTKVIEVSSPELFHYPMIFMCGDTEFAPFTKSERERLRRYLELGGLLVADDCVGQDDAGFDKSFRREAAAIFPKHKLAKLSQDHSVMRSYYLIRQVCGRLADKPYLEGVTIGDRTPIIYSRNDMAGAWAYDAFGNWEYEVFPGGKTQREWAIRLGVNIIMYALTVNYKRDQVHVPFILKRRRSWRR